MKNHILILLSLFFCFSETFAQQEKDSVRIHFRVSHVKIDTNFEDNGVYLDSIFKKLSTDSHLDGPSRKLHSVKVTGSASPEGSVAFNKKLSVERAHSIFDEFRKRGYFNDSIASFEYLGRDWKGLQSEVECDSLVPFREDVLALLNKINGVTPPLHPLKELKALHDGVPYAYLYKSLFAELRAAGLIVTYDLLYPHILVPDMPLEQPLLLSEVNVETDDIETLPYNSFGTVKECKPVYIGMKTNMLYDVLLIPNIGAEFYVGKNWSLLADWMYGWWDRDRTHYYWRAYGGDLGARWWFGKSAHEKPLTGHHLGIFAGVVTYDFELGKGGIMGGLPNKTLWDRCNFISGVEYGYSLPIARRLNIDFTLGIGYLGGKYLKYEPKDGFYMWQSTHKLRWFGPTKAEISLVWLIGCDNQNRGKGGMR